MPRLWGDDTVRAQERPWKGAQEGGASGFVKGIGNGIRGSMAKPGAALFGILGHMVQGVSKEVQKLFGSDVQSYTIASRAAQGYEEWLQGFEAEKQDVIAWWKLIQKALKKKEIPKEINQLYGCNLDYNF